MSAHVPTIPEGLDLIKTSDGVIIRRNWFTWAVLPMLVFAIFWDGFLVFWYSTALKTHGPMMMILFPLIHVAVGVGLTYFVLASFVNKTDVTVTLSGVGVRTYPAPWPGNKYISANDITDVIVRERTNTNRGRVSVKYLIMYADQSHKERQLVSQSQSEQAEFIADAIRKAIDLKPQDS